MNLKLGLNEKQVNRLISKPGFQQQHIINDNVALMKLSKSHIVLDKPIFIGFTVLEHSKNYMYKLHYNLFKKHYKSNITLLYTDTDSLIYEIKSKIFYNDLKFEFREIFDFSNFVKNHELYDEKHKKEIGYLKSEYGDKVMNEFVGIKSKLYSIFYNNKIEKRTAKGLQKVVLKNFVTHKHYQDVIINKKAFNCKMNRIQSTNHELQTVKLKKLIFTCFDDKRYILDDGINTIPFGHYSII